MIRIETGSRQTDEMISALAEKLNIPPELDLAVYACELIQGELSGTAVILCDEEKVSDLRTLYGENVYFLTRPVSFSAFAEIASSLRVPSLQKESAKEAFSFDKASGTVRICDNSVTLTPKESELFSYLLKRNGQAVSRDELRRALWSDTAETNAPDVYVSYLRRKLRRLFGDGVLVNERGVGYILKNIN